MIAETSELLKDAYFLLLPVLRIIMRFQPSAVSNFFNFEGFSIRVRSEVFFGAFAALGFFLKKREIIAPLEGQSPLKFEFRMFSGSLSRN